MYQLHFCAPKICKLQDCGGTNLMQGVSLWSSHQRYCLTTLIRSLSTKGNRQRDTSHFSWFSTISLHFRAILVFYSFGSSSTVHTVLWNCVWSFKVAVSWVLNVCVASFGSFLINLSIKGLVFKHALGSLHICETSTTGLTLFIYSLFLTLLVRYSLYFAVSLLRW